MNERCLLGGASVLAALVAAIYALAFFPATTITVSLVFSFVTVCRWIWHMAGWATTLPQ